MYVRMLGIQEILPALHLVWEVFAEDLAPVYTREGVEEFQKFIKYENIIPKVQSGELVFFGAWDEDVLCGVGAVQRRGHISLLFVKKDRQRQGIGRMIFQSICQYLSQIPGVGRVTVHAAPSAVEAYRHLGMYAIAPEQFSNGIQFVPMEMQIFSGATQKPNSKKKVWIIVAIIAVVLSLMVGLLCFIVYKVAKSDVVTEIEEFDEYYNDDIYGDPFDEYYDESEEIGGIEAIPEYIDEHTGYELGEDSYVLNPEDVETTRTTIVFEIYYPQLTGLDEAVQEKVNEELKNCAMETAERIYLNPTDEIKEKVLGEEYPVLMSYVEYKVTYLSEDIISVVYQDYSYEGSQNDYHLELRTKNISLKDGTVYEVKDIVKLNDRFIKDWAEEMRDEADTDTLISELDSEEMKAVLSGDDMDGVYKDNFFLDKEGIEIGLSFGYSEDDENNSGYSWVTAPFDWDEIKEYKTDSDFWDLVK